MWLARPLELQPQLLSKRRYQLCRGIDRGSLIRDRRVTAEHAEISYEPETSASSALLDERAPAVLRVERQREAHRLDLVQFAAEDLVDVRRLEIEGLEVH